MSDPWDVPFGHSVLEEVVSVLEGRLRTLKLVLRLPLLEASQDGTVPLRQLLAVSTV